MLSLGTADTLSDAVGEASGTDPPADTDGAGSPTVPSPLGTSRRVALGSAEAAPDASTGEAALPDADADGPSLGPAVPAEAVPAVPDGTAEAPPDGSPDDGPPGVEACRGRGSCVDTPGWRIGAIGGFFGSGCGVIPDTQA